jgi:hypothetical protein
MARIGRPLKEGAGYFPHDTNAAEDEKIDALRSSYGNDGYAFYFIILERIYKNGGQFDISNSYIRVALAKKIFITDEKFTEMLNACFTLNLFDKKEYEENQVLTSDGIKKRCRKITGGTERARKYRDKLKSEAALESCDKPVAKSLESRDKLETEQNKTEQNIEQNKRGKEKIYKKEKPPEKLQWAEYVSMTNAEHSALTAKYGTQQVRRMVEILDNYKGANPQRRKYASDYRAILTWVVDKHMAETQAPKPRGQPSMSCIEAEIEKAKQSVMADMPEAEAIEVG